MNNANMLRCLQDLQKAEDQILLLKLYDEDNYNYFANKIESIRQALIEFDDDKSTYDATQIIHDVALLETEISDFMRKGKRKEGLGLLDDQWGGISGEEAAKQHIIGVFQKLVISIGEMDNIDIGRLKELKEQWEAEKAKHKYSDAELYTVEEALAKTFLNYQIKTCRSEGKLSKEAKEDFCLPEVYERVFKKRVLDYAVSLPKDSTERLNLERLLMNWSFDTAINNPDIWKGLTGREIDLAKVQTNEISTSTKQEPNPQNLPVAVNKELKGNAVLIVYEKKKADGSVELKKKIKYLDHQGRFRLFFHKDRVVELHFLEGTKELKFTEGGKSTSSYSHLSEFPNLRNVYLPSTLKSIEQGYFLNCDNLDNLFLGKGTIYSPNSQLFPDKAKIVENAEKTENFEVIQEFEESAALFTQVSQTGEHRTIKVPLSTEGKLPKTFVMKGYTGLEDLRFTKGTQRISYSGMPFQGGNYSELIGLKKIILPESLREIGEGTFKNCDSLEEIYLPEGLERISKRAFEKCTNLTKINFSNGLKYIEEDAFRECKSLNQLAFPESLYSIGMSAFGDCEKLETVQFPETMGTIGIRTFKNCYKLSNLKFPTKMERIDEQAFENCSSLKTLCLPRHLDYLEKKAFGGCTQLYRALVPREYKHFDDYAFPYSDLKYAVVPSDFHGFVGWHCTLIRTDEMPEDIDPEKYLEDEINKYKQNQEKETKREGTKEQQSPNVDSTDKTGQDEDIEI